MMTSQGFWIKRDKLFHFLKDNVDPKFDLFIRKISKLGECKCACGKIVIHPKDYFIARLGLFKTNRTLKYVNLELHKLCFEKNLHSERLILSFL
jgi:hypothetical protein